MTTNAVAGKSLTLSAEGTTLAGATSFTISFSQATIDVTSADSNWNDEFLAGRRSVSIDAEMLYIYSDPGKRVLQAHFTDRSPTTVTCVLTTPDGNTFTGEGIVTSLSYTGGFEDAMTASASIAITDGITAASS